MLGQGRPEGHARAQLANSAIADERTDHPEFPLSTQVGLVKSGDKLIQYAFPTLTLTSIGMYRIDDVVSREIVRDPLAKRKSGFKSSIAPPSNFRADLSPVVSGLPPCWPLSQTHLLSRPQRLHWVHGRSPHGWQDGGDQSDQIGLWPLGLRSPGQAWRKSRPRHRTPAGTGCTRPRSLYPLR